MNLGRKLSANHWAQARLSFIRPSRIYFDRIVH
jgi:hypothetical protein